MPHRAGLAKAGIVLAAALLAAALPAEAKTCKNDVIAARGVSRANAHVKMREARAKQAALVQWRSQVQQAYGFAYRFWSRAADKKVDCVSTPSRSRCVISARPCRLL